MTVQSTENKIIYDGNGVANVFDIPFYFINTNDIKVSVNDSFGTRALVLDEDYSLVGAGNIGGKVTLPEPLPVGNRLSILREVDYTQNMEIPENDRFPSANMERALDKLTMQVQQLAELQERAVTVDLFSDANPSVLVDKIEVLYDYKDDLTAVADKIESVANVSDNMAAVLDAPNQANAAAGSAADALGYMEQTFHAADQAEASAGAAGVSAGQAAGSAENAEESARRAAEGIFVIEAQSGTVDLTANTVYSMTVSGETVFSLPVDVDVSKHVQIKMFLNLVNVVPVNWGTNVFFNAFPPDVSETGHFCLYWDFDPAIGWVCGAMKEVAEEQAEVGDDAQE